MPMSSHGVCSILVACSFSSPFAYVQQANVASSAHKSVALTQIPLPSGSFGIGRIGLQLVDASRADDYDPKQRRKLMVYLWYPTSKSPTAKGQYFPGAAQMDAMPEVHSLMNRDFGSAWAGIVSGEISSHAIDRALIAGSQTPFPVVTFSHGLGSTGFQYTVLIEDLVSHGYVVASIEHTYTANAVWFPDGRVVTLHRDAPPAGLPQAEHSKLGANSVSMGINEGAADIRFVIDRLTQLNQDKRQFTLAGAIDLKRLAAMGHSAGAEFAARACQQDSRIRACVDLDGAMVPVAALPVFDEDRTMRQPLLFLEAYHPENRMGGMPDQLADFKKMEQQQFQELRAGSYQVVLHSPDIAHPSFSDVPLLFHGQDGFPETPIVLHNLDHYAIRPSVSRQDTVGREAATVRWTCFSRSGSYRHRIWPLIATAAEYRRSLLGPGSNVTRERRGPSGKQGSRESRGPSGSNPNFRVMSGSAVTHQEPGIQTRITLTVVSISRWNLWLSNAASAGEWTS